MPGAQRPVPTGAPAARALAGTFCACGSGTANNGSGASGGSRSGNGGGVVQ